ncbi:MAG TPA: DUF5689 domain-containing protein [Flavobacteriaceae bacterium]|nr:DUF5689 domain-containing protein [Flavobacteriaceae bacterium]
MKRNLNHLVFSLFMTCIIGGFIGCVNDEDYSIPTFEVQEPDVVVNFTIANLKRMIADTPSKIESETPLYLEAYVVSSDEAGNFHKNLVIQDAPENPTAGISIATHATDMYAFFEPGRRVYIRVDGLYVGHFHGLPSLGANGVENIERMSIEEFDKRVLRSTITEEIIPTEIPINQIKDTHINTLIQLNEVEFLSEYVGLPYVGVDSGFGEDRIIQDCYDNKVIMRNSGYADFRGDIMPEGNGSLVSVLSIFYETHQLLIRDTDDVQFYEERCALPVEGGMPFKEDFTNHPAGYGYQVELPGWSNINVNGGDGHYEVREFGGNKYAQVSAYGSNEDPFEVWLITPGVTLDKVDPILVFDSKDGHFNGDALTIHLSTDFEGNIETASWVDITDQADIPTGHTGWEDSFTNSGEIDLSDYAGQEVFVAFRYLGADFMKTTTYQLDNIEIRSRN